MKLIDKDKLVSEIERRLEAIANTSTDNNRELSAIKGAQQYELINLIQFLDTLEIKEVSLNLEAVVMPSDSSFWVNKDELSDFEDGDDVDILIIKK